MKKKNKKINLHHIPLQAETKRFDTLDSKNLVYIQLTFSKS